MDTVVDLVAAVAWPVVVLILLVVMRREIRSVGTAIVRRIDSDRADVSIGPAGLEIRTRVEAVAARVETLEVGQAQYGDLVLAQATVRPDDEARELEQLANEYLAIAIDDYRERVRTKDAYARRLGALAWATRVPRDSLADSTNEGLILSLAALVMLAPEVGDPERLMRAASHARRLHVRYYLVVAFDRLYERWLVDDATSIKISRVLSDLSVQADDHLLRRIRSSRGYVNLG